MLNERLNCKAVHGKKRAPYQGKRVFLFLSVNLINCKPNKYEKKGLLITQVLQRLRAVGKPAASGGRVPGCKYVRDATSGGTRPDEVAAWAAPAGGLVAPGRFELPLTVPKTVVLPLDDGAGQ